MEDYIVKRKDLKKRVQDELKKWESNGIKLDPDEIIIPRKFVVPNDKLFDAELNMLLAVIGSELKKTDYADYSAAVERVWNRIEIERFGPEEKTGRMLKFEKLTESEKGKAMEYFNNYCTEVFDLDEAHEDIKSGMVKIYAENARYLKKNDSNDFFTKASPGAIVSGIVDKE